MKKLLVLNSGSSSLKFKLFEVPGLEPHASGAIEEIGGSAPTGHIEVFPMRKGPAKHYLGPRTRVKDHRDALGKMASLLSEAAILDSLHGLYAIGHRVVHGGEHFKSPQLIDRDVLFKIKELVPLAPLHNPSNILGIEVAFERAPEVPQVAVFDTSFHQTIPDHAFIYAIPKEYYSIHGIRRYGFHGTSHAYVARRAAQYLQRSVGELRLITLHLGNGASCAAIGQGRCLDTSMGFTPLEGLMMGTRCGDIDPSIVFHIARSLKMGLDEIENLLNRASGLKGICGESDMRNIIGRYKAGDADAGLAVRMFTYRIKKYIGAYGAVLGGIDCLVFTGGIGENSPEIRRICTDGLGFLGIEIDAEKNEMASHSTAVTEISREISRVKVLVVPTDEEHEIAHQTMRVVGMIQGEICRPEENSPKK